MLPTAELLVMETTRSAACPKQLSTKRNRRKRKHQDESVKSKMTVRVWDGRASLVASDEARVTKPAS